MKPQGDFGKILNRAMRLMAGPGFGQHGLSQKAAVHKLIEEGIDPDEAWSISIAAVLELKRKNIEVKKTAQVGGRPNSLAQWATYIQGLAGRPLYSQAVAANTHTFARTLLEEGATMGDVEQVLLLFVRQLRATGTKVPGGGPFNLPLMAMMDPDARQGATYSPEEVAFLETTVKSGEDDLDAFDRTAA